MRRFFISDLHFYHKNILKFGKRNQFASLEEMHEHVIAMWNKTVTKRDLVYIVGDFSFGSYDETKSVLDQLNGNKILVLGNHDLKSKRHITRKQYFDMGFQDVADELIIKLSNAENVYLKHYPYKERMINSIWRKLTWDKDQYRTYHQLYPARTDMWHICGHHHGQVMVRGNEINVSCETLNYKPLSEVEVVKIMNRSKHVRKQWAKQKGRQFGYWLLGLGNGKLRRLWARLLQGGS